MLKTISNRLRYGLAATALIAYGAASAHATTTVALSGNVAGWVGRAVSTGTAPDSQSVKIVVHMAFRNSDSLKAMVAAVSKPGAPQYGRYLTPAQFAAQFAPGAADVSAVQTLLGAAGMTGIAVGPANAYVTANATVQQLRATFGVSQNLYSYAGRTLRANKEAPVLPAALAGKVLFIEGLDDTTLLKHPFHRSAITEDGVAAAGISPNAPTPPPIAASLPSPYCDHYFNDLRAHLSTQPAPYGDHLPWLSCGYTPQQIGQAYGMNQTTLDGTGVTVAIVDAYASPTLIPDGERYAKNHGLPVLTMNNFTQIIPPGIHHVNPLDPCMPVGWWTEQSLDVASVHGAAPGAHIVYVGATDCGAGLTTALIDTIMLHRADVITNSYGYNGESVDLGTITSEDQAAMAAATMGISVLFSSGDDGDLSQVNGVATGSYEATSPYVTAVGGTSLGLLNAAGTKYEWGWGTYRDFLNGVQVNSGTSVTTTGLATVTNFGYTYPAFAFYSGAGGGVSLAEPEPDYQKPIVPTTLSNFVNYASGNTAPLANPGRVTPDIAMLADPYTGYLIGQSFTISSNPFNNQGCTPTSATTEYCEFGEGGTSLASPLMAGVLAIVDEARMKAGKALVGFANPWLYGQKIGLGLKGSGINDIKPPVANVAVLRGYASNLNEMRVVTINSVPFLIDTVPFAIVACGSTICEGLDDVFNYVTPGYDDVTGLGVPYVPKLITQ